MGDVVLETPALNMDAPKAAPTATQVKLVLAS